MLLSKNLEQASYRVLWGKHKFFIRLDRVRNGMKIA